MGNSKGETIETQFVYPTDETSCKEDCYLNYQQELVSECGDLTIAHVLESQQCKELWDLHVSEYENCIACIDQNDPDCEGRSLSSYCSNVLFNSLDTDGYFTCLENSADNFNSCQKQAFVNYMICKADVNSCLLNQYETSTNPQDKAIALMNLSQLKNIPVSTKVIYDGIELSKSFFKYDIWHDRPYLQSTTMTYQQGTERVLNSVERYDDRGNPLEILDRITGIRTAYIWGYYQTQPVAQVVNARYADIEALAEFGTDFSLASSLSSAQNNSLRNNLSDAQVTTYSYVKGAGLGSITDPNGHKSEFIYDELERLKATKDFEGNITQKIEYQYGN